MEHDVGRRMIAHTEEWWGDSLGPDLVAAMKAAPFYQLEAFYDEWPWAKKFRANPELHEFPLPELAPGELRPVLRGEGVWDSSVLSLLLYSNSVVLGSEFLSMFHGFAINARYGAGLDEEELRDETVHAFAQLAELRPLIDRDLVHFTNIVAMPYQYRDYLEGDESEQRFERALRRAFPNITDEELAEHRADSDLARVRYLAAQKEATPVALTEVESRVLSTVAGANPIDGRRKATEKLARAVVPTVGGSIRDICALRSDEELFAQWRDSLTGALNHVLEFSASPGNSARAKSVLAREMRAATDDLSRRVDSQGALSRMWTGGREFTVISASTALAALWASSVPVSFESGVGAGVLGATVGHLFDNRAARRARKKEQRNEELIGRLILGFLDNPDAARSRWL
ncbi:hypothetical protein [Mycobacteroides abscessus]|uniref:hypothetical protein n=1 Tax=Mycobacteroides abscessus TaxID=36809 RepID=UPI001878A986|nr:hypothetical protein [Mycobacteroides abscessus]